MKQISKDKKRSTSKHTKSDQKRIRKLLNQKVTEVSYPTLAHGMMTGVYGGEGGGE